MLKMRDLPKQVGGRNRDRGLHIKSHCESARWWQDIVRGLVRIQAERCASATIRLWRMSNDPDGNRKKLDAKPRRVTFVGYSETEKNFRVYDWKKRKMLVSCNIKFNETKTTSITDESYGEQEIGSDYGDECYVEFVPSSSQEEIKNEGVESCLKLDETRKLRSAIARFSW